MDPAERLKSPVGLCDLPEPLVAHALARLCAHDLAQAARACRLLRAAAADAATARVRSERRGGPEPPTRALRRTEVCMRPTVASGCVHTLWVVGGTLHASGSDPQLRADLSHLGLTASEAGVRRGICTPTPVPRLSGVRIVEVAAGICHSLALGASGRVWAFGRSQYGQCGYGPSASVEPGASTASHYALCHAIGPRVSGLAVATPSL